ncbi:MAG: hypothetical protein HY554_05610, partial [Elusimicrobia bacterium]|nr:hypothetical protein [Elusimicrobiota bacterium]
LAERLGGQGLLAGLLASPAGGWALLGLSAGVVLGLGAAVGRRVPRAAPAAAAAASAPLLDGVRSGIVIDGPRDKSLQFVARANEGEIRFDDRRAAAAQAEIQSTDVTPEGAEPQAPAVEDILAGQIPGLPPGAAEDLAAGRFGQLSSGLSTVASAKGFGGMDGKIRGGTGGFNLKRPSLLPQLEARGRAAALRRQSARSATQGLRRQGARSNLASGQLKLARNMSSAATRAGTREEAASAVAGDAFEQGRTQGGDLALPAMGPAASPGVVVPPGAGAPDPMTMPSVPAIGPIREMTAYQPALDMARNLGDQAGQFRTMGIAMLVLGGVLIAAGIKLLHWPTTAIGIALIAAGAAAIAMCIMMLSMAQNMSKQAKQIANQIQNAFEQTDQTQIAAEAAQAKADGRAYTPPDISHKTRDNAELRQNIQRERDATYQYQAQ